ncbi:hypothetical protein S40288_10070 [Stachybotrys chartarum IBT 40288]|nr:hypothetical protein S40288_10070 [Stachybotrys chartarum IBT 40288]
MYRSPRLLTTSRRLVAAVSNAAIASHCPGDSDDLCFQWGVPEASASAGSGNVYIQLRASTSLSWAGLGIGSRMAGADIFLIYQDGNGNVTLSTRAGSGHMMPQYEARQGVELVEGSGIVDGHMVANIRCSGCSSLDLAGSNNWIAAWLPGDSLDSSDPAEPINIHSDNTMFQVDMAEATISSDQNPFLASSGNNGSSGNDGDDQNDGDRGGAVTEQDSDDNNTLRSAHGVIMTIVFVVAYPVGALLMPIFGKWFIHAGWQMIAFLGMWIGFALGYILTEREGESLDEAHMGLGTFIVALLGLQPILGWLHHRHYLKHQARGVAGKAHIWYGRVLTILGIVNGGLGLQLSGADAGFVIAYSVIAGAICIAWIAFCALTAFRRSPRARPAAKQGPHGVNATELEERIP